MGEKSVIRPDDDPFNADWIQITHWDKLLAKSGNIVSFAKALGEEGFALDEFKTFHYFDYLAKRHPWLSEA